MAVINGVTMKCSLCAAWDKKAKQDGFSECHKDTPACHVDRQGGRVGVWPMTEKDDYCLAFVAET